MLTLQELVEEQEQIQLQLSGLPEMEQVAIIILNANLGKSTVLAQDNDANINQ